MFGDFWTCTWEEATLEGGKQWGQTYIEFYNKSFTSLLDMSGDS